MCAMSDYSLTFRVYASDIQIMMCQLPPPDDYHESNPHPDIRCTASNRIPVSKSHATPCRPESACITCVADGDQVCVAAAWSMSTVARQPELYVKAFYVRETEGQLASEEVFHERPLSSLHTASCLSISCCPNFNKLCVVGTRPSPPSTKHVAATEIIRMRKFGSTSPLGCVSVISVHSLSTQALDDFNSLRSDLKKCREQRANTAPRSGDLHAVGGASTPCGVYSQFLRQSQWWQVCDCVIDFVFVREFCGMRDAAHAAAPYPAPDVELCAILHMPSIISLCVTRDLFMTRARSICPPASAGFTSPTIKSQTTGSPHQLSVCFGP